MNFYISLKVIKENGQKNELSNKQRILQQQTLRFKQLEQIAKLKYNYSSSQMAELYPLLQASTDHSTLQP